MRSLRTNVQLPDVLLRLLYMRGINNYAKVVKFFKPTKDKLYNPFLMKDCDKAAARVIKAIGSSEKIMILGDYDVDGTCGVSMFYLFLKQFGIDAPVYIPDRIAEGYGISRAAIDKAHAEGIKLIISIDCGITAVDKVAYAKELGIEFIICDHHQPPEEIPAALAVMDPLRKDCEYPYKYLCGTGVAFKLIQAVCAKLEKLEYPITLLDFVAIATASDIVPITDENRILVKEGFILLNTNPRPSIRTLIETSGLKMGCITTTNVVFSVAPRINAVGRLGDAKRAVELLTSTRESELKELANILDGENSNRREIDKSITEHAFKLCDEHGLINGNHAIVIHNDTWHPGVIGIVAARLVEKYNLPSIVLTTVNGVAKGSARSINGFNIYEALKRCEDKLIQFGGHYHAAGLEIKVEKIEEFKNYFNEIASTEITKEQLIPEMQVDAEITFKDITDQFVKILNFFEPFGPANTTPIFTTKNVQIVGDIRYAKGNTHIFKLREEESGIIFDAVFFASEAFHDDLVTGRICNICYSIEQNVWNGVTKTKLRIRDITFC
jgi:single-stranded-DNA-specific exonuclease